MAQQVGASTGGVAAVDGALRFLGHHKRVLMVGAHPDDEDTELLTVLVRGMGAEAAYLSLTRGEGGQNLIGAELGVALGVLRTEELLAARRLDGAGQFFTRAYDFGYSKGLPDTWTHWPRDSVLKDVVRVIRRFRPQVVIAMFSGTPRDGHGQHQAAGWATREGFAASGDSVRFPELGHEEGLRPWQPMKLFQSARFDTAGTSVVLEGGQLDPVVGQSYLQIAMRGRSLHRSQDMGVPQRIGPSAVRLRLLEGRTGQASGLFSGIDTGLASLAREGKGRAAEAGRLRVLGEELGRLRPWDLHSLPGLRQQFLGLLGGEPDALSTPAADQLRRIDEALFAGSGVICDGVSANEFLVPGQPGRVVLSCWNASPDTVSLSATLIALGREVGRIDPTRVGPGAILSDTLVVEVPLTARLTGPYYHRGLAAPAGDMYRWWGSPTDGQPFEPPPLVADYRLGGAGPVRREVTYRFIDQAIGEVRRPVMVVPQVAVALDPANAFWHAGEGGHHRFTVTLRAAGREAARGEVRLEVPAGWDAGAPQRFDLSARGAEQRIGFTVRPPAGVPAGRFRVDAVAMLDTARYDLGVVRVDYPHVRPRQLVQSATSEVVLAEFERRSDPVAYVRGAADRIPESLLALGVPVVLLGPDSLARGDLTRFPVVIVGPRAYETEPALLEHSDRLLDYARAGGTVLVQYQQQPYFRGGFAPFPLSLSPRLVGEDAPFRVQTPRVAEETAPVRVLDPDHSLFTEPNRIGAEDWDQWIQERGLYFAGAWGPEWIPLLEMGDEGEPALRGGLLLAAVGNGRYVYTGLSFFRQLPAGVPGAIRLFLNLLALR